MVQVGRGASARRNTKHLLERPIRLLMLLAKSLPATDASGFMARYLAKSTSKRFSHGIMATCEHAVSTYNNANGTRSLRCGAATGGSVTTRRRRRPPHDKCGTSSLPGGRSTRRWTGAFAGDAIQGRLRPSPAGPYLWALAHRFRSLSVLLGTFQLFVGTFQFFQGGVVSSFPPSRPPQSLLACLRTS